MAQTAAPASDVTDGSWTASGGGTVLFAAIDEAVASDSDFILSPDLAPGNSDECEIALGPITDPASSSGHSLAYRYRAQGTDPIDLVVSLYCGAILIASQTHTSVGASFVDGTLTLSGAEADAITDYSDLRIRFNAVCPSPAPGGGAGEAIGLLLALTKAS